MPIVFESRVFNVEAGKQRFPDGREHDVAIVRHRPSVVLIPFADDGRVILVRQYRAPLERYTWEFPAGSIDPGESPQAGAARECEEEIGLTPGRIDLLGSWYPIPGYCDEQMFFFTVSALGPPAPDSAHRPDEDENIETQTVTIAFASSMVAKGEIVDLKTAYALTLIRA